MSTTTTWAQDRADKKDKWDRTDTNGTRGYVRKFEHAYGYFWQAERNDYRLTGSGVDREAAMAKADEAMALPTDEFNRRICENLMIDIRRIERAILQLSPHTDLLPGYHAGYEAGLAHARQLVASALGIPEAETTTEAA